MAHPPLQFELQNTNPLAKGKAILYITPKLENNQLQLSITNKSGKALELKGNGTVVGENEVKADGPTAIYLSLSGIFDGDKAKLGEIEVSSPNWKAQFLPSPGISNYGLSPEKNLQLAEGETLTISLKNIPVEQSSRVGFLSVDLYNMGDVKPSSHQSHITVANLPDGKKKDLKDFLKPAWVGNYSDVYISKKGLNPFPNKLSFTLTNGSLDAPLVPEGTPSEKGTPIFTLSFVYAHAPGYGALSTTQVAKDISLRAVNLFNNDWEYNSNSEGELPAWSLRPRDREILGSGKSARAAVEFEFSNILTYLQDGITQLYISWQYIPGYYDGSTYLPIQKLYPPSIDKFEADPPSVVLEAPDKPVSVNLSWEVSNNPGQLFLNGQSIDKNNKAVKVNSEIKTQTYTLSIPFGGKSRPFNVEKTLDIPVSFKSPDISFSASADKLDFLNKNVNPLTISWNVNYAKSVSFDPESFIPGLQPDNGKIDIRIMAADLMDLTLLPGIDMKGFELTLIAKGWGRQKSQRKLLTLVDAGWEYLSMELMSKYVEALQKSLSSISESELRRLPVDNKKLIADYAKLSQAVNALLVSEVTLFAEAAIMANTLSLEVDQDPDKASRITQEINTQLIKPAEKLISQHEDVITLLKVFKAEVEKNGITVKDMTNMIRQVIAELNAEIARSGGKKKRALQEKIKQEKDSLVNFEALKASYIEINKLAQQEFDILVAQENFWQVVEHNWSGFQDEGKGIPQAMRLKLFFQLFKTNLTDHFKKHLSRVASPPGGHS